MIETLDITVPIKPISTNAIHRSIVRGRHAQSIKSKEYREFKDSLNIMLARESEDIDKFINRVSSLDQPLYMTANYVVEMPWNSLITKKGEISKISLDWDNCIKGFQDCFFDFMGMTDHLIITGHLDMIAVSQDRGWSTTVEIVVNHLEEKIVEWDYH